jgi:hypothetical protein
VGEVPRRRAGRGVDGRAVAVGAGVDDVDGFVEGFDLEHIEHGSKDLGPDSISNFTEYVTRGKPTPTHLYAVMSVVTRVTVGPTQLPSGKPSTVGFRPSSRISPCSSVTDWMSELIRSRAAGEMTGPLDRCQRAGVRDAIVETQSQRP